jgi:hypothetical protein
VPLFLSNCSEREPSEGTYFDASLTNPSAYVETALMMLVKVDELLA